MHTELDTKQNKANNVIKIYSKNHNYEEALDYLKLDSSSIDDFNELISFLRTVIILDIPIVNIEQIECAKQPDFVIKDQNNKPLYGIEVTSVGYGHTIDEQFDIYLKDAYTSIKLKLEGDGQHFLIEHLSPVFEIRPVISNEDLRNELDKNIYYIYLKMSFHTLLLKKIDNEFLYRIDPIARYTIIKYILNFISGEVNSISKKIIPPQDFSNFDNLLKKAIKLIDLNIVDVGERESLIFKLSHLSDTFIRDQLSVSADYNDSSIGNAVYYTIIDHLIIKLVKQSSAALGNICSLMNKQHELLPIIKTYFEGKEIEETHIHNIYNILCKKFDGYNEIEEFFENKILTIKLNQYFPGSFNNQFENYIQLLVEKINNDESLINHKFFTRVLIFERAENSNYFLIEKNPQQNIWILQQNEVMITKKS